MPSQKPSRDPLASLFRDVVLVLGGVFAVRGTDDETIRRVAVGLESAYCRARREQAARARAALVPHPAIAALLRLTDQDEAAEP